MKSAYTTGQVAKLLDVSIQTVIRWAESGRLPSYRIPGSTHRRIRGDALAFFISDNGLNFVATPGAELCRGGSGL